MVDPADYGAVADVDPSQFGAVRDATAPREANGVWDDLVSGYQGSATGLMARGKLPDVELNPSHAAWYDKALEGIGSTISDLPEMIAGGATGGYIGSKVAGPRGGLIGMGAGAMAVPAEIRASLIKSYQSGDTSSSADFLSRTGIIIKGLADSDVQKETAKAALVGGITAGSGMYASRLFGNSIAPMIGSTISPRLAMGLIRGAEAGGAITGLAVTPAALEGRLPEPSDFTNAAIVVGGMKLAASIAGKMGQIYSATGRTPEEVVADAQNVPEIAEQLKADTPITELPEEYKPLAAEENAKQAIPDPKFLTDEQKQAFMEQPFADIPQEPGQPKVALYPNINYINSPEDALASLARATEIVGNKILEQTRGKVPLAQQEQEMASTLADMVGAKDTSLLQARTPGTGSGTTEMWIRGQLMKAAADDFTAKAKAYDSLTASPQDGIELQAAAERVAMLSANFQGAASETGRALQALKMINSGMRQADAIKKLMDGSPDPAKIAEVMKDVNNPVAAAKVARIIAAPEPLNNWQKWGQVYKAGLLSGTKTYMVKAIGDAVNVASTVVERIVASGIGILHGGDKVSPTEALGYMSGMLHGSSDALKVAVSTWTKEGFAKNEANAWEGHTNVFGVGENGEPPEPGSAAAIANKVIAFPSRVMGVETEAFRQLNESGEAQALAIRQAITEKFTPGTDDFNAKVLAIRNNPSEEMQAAITKAGDDGTFTGKLGSFGKIMSSVSKHDQGQFILPFSTVPANLVTWSVKRMPLLANMLNDVQDDFKAGGARRDIAIARQLIGAAVATAAYGAVKDGNLTGGGTYMTPEEKNAKTAAGWQPYSLKVGGKFYSYNRFDPMARIAAVAADAAEIQDHMSEDDKANLPAMVAAAFGNALVNQTYLSSINGLLEAIKDPDRSGAMYFDNFIGSWVPAFMGQIASASDSQARRIDSLMDELKSKIPGLRQTLLPKIDPLTGKPLQNTSHLDLTPVNVSDISNDPVLTEASRLGVGVSKAPKNIEIAGKLDREIGKVALTPAQQNIFSSASGKLVHEVMTNIVGSDSWNDMPDIVRKEVFSTVIQKANQVGRAEALTPEQREAETSRIMTELQAKLRGQ